MGCVCSSRGVPNVIVSLFNFLPSEKLSTEVNQEFLYCLIRQSQDGIALSQLGIF